MLVLDISGKFPQWKYSRNISPHPQKVLPYDSLHPVWWQTLDIIHQIPFLPFLWWHI
jgi:hypothetical protein